MADYSFLNNYLASITENADKNDPNVNIDHNQFYNVPNEDQDNGDFAPYGYTHDTPVEEVSDDDDNQYDQDDDNQYDQHSSMTSSLLGDDSDMYSDDSDDNQSDEGDETGGSNYYGSGQPHTMSTETSDIGGKIAKNESEGMGGYNAFNSKGGGAGAVGKYQFRWNLWKDSIMKVTGVKSEDQFRKSPQAQEKYFAWYQKNYLKPAADQLKPYNKKGLSDDQLQELVHFRGSGGAKKWLMGQQGDKPEAYNIPTSKYIGTKAMGGTVGVASTPAQQSAGLNNPSFTHMFFPMQGRNSFRGLDDGTPVQLEDETGNKKVLKGKKHKTVMTGNVYESRLNK